MRAGPAERIRRGTSANQTVEIANMHWQGNLMFAMYRQITNLD